MAAGCPVVARKAGGLKDIVRQHINGWFVETNDPKDFALTVDRVLSDPTALEKARRNASEEQRSSQRTWEHASLSVFHACYKS
jgi:D-inositol-3-phosphate glycosyltransferase